MPARSLRIAIFGISPTESVLMFRFLKVRKPQINRMTLANPIPAAHGASEQPWRRLQLWEIWQFRI